MSAGKAGDRPHRLRAPKIRLGQINAFGYHKFINAFIRFPQEPVLI
jgi:hypothetical protein